MHVSYWYGVNRLRRNFYDRNSKELPPLTPGESIRIRQEKVWEPAVVTATHCAPRSYHVMTQDGQVYRRNRKHLRKTLEFPPPITPLPLEDQLANRSTTMPHSQDPAEQASSALQPEAVSTQVVTPPIRRSSRIKRLPTHLNDYVV